MASWDPYLGAVEDMKLEEADTDEATQVFVVQIFNAFAVSEILDAPSFFESLDAPSFLKFWIPRVFLMFFNFCNLRILGNGKNCRFAFKNGPIEFIVESKFIFGSED